MIYGFISDIHGRLDLLARVLRTFENRSLGKENIVCLGDIVSEFPSPETNICIDLLKERTGACVRGNHDEYALHTMPGHISAESYDYLAKLPESLQLGELRVVHDNPDLSSRIGVHPLYRVHIKSDMHAEAAFASDAFKSAVIGHNHLAKVFWEGGSQSMENGGIFVYNPEKRYIFSVGAVSHSRDANINPSCAILDTEKHTFEIIRPN